MSQEPIQLEVTQVEVISDGLAVFAMQATDPRRVENLQWIPGQVGVLATGEAGKGYFACASAPEDRAHFEFLIKRGQGVSASLFEQGAGALVEMTGPLGKGFPIDNYRGRDLLLIGVGTAIAPLRSVIRSILTRRQEFGRLVVIYGARHPSHFAFQDEFESWPQYGVKVFLTVSQPGESAWTGATGYVHHLLEESCYELNEPVALVCGMKEMMQQTAEELARIRPGIEVLTNF